MVRVPCCERMGMKKGPWTAEEDQILISYIQRYGHENWRALPRQAGLLRCGKSCRLRWTNYLRPDIKRGNFTKEEQETIINLHQMLGNRWSAIATKLPGRTDNEIKNYWHTHLKKRVEENPAPSTSLAITAAAAASERLMRLSSSILGTNHPPPPADSNFQKNGYNNYPQDNNLHNYYGHEQNYHHHGCISTAAAQVPFANNKYNYYYYSMDGLLDSSSRAQILSTNGEYSAVLQQQPWGAAAAGNHEYCNSSDMVFWYDLLVKSQQENQEKVA